MVVQEECYVLVDTPHSDDPQCYERVRNEDDGWLWLSAADDDQNSVFRYSLETGEWEDDEQRKIVESELVAIRAKLADGWRPRDWPSILAISATLDAGTYDGAKVVELARDW